MALYHVHADVIRKGKTKGGATGFAQYIAREHSEKATQYVRYIGREGDAPDDLVAKGYGGLPAWAKDGTHFFLIADRYERTGTRHPGTVARTYEMALPRELSPVQRDELAADIRATFFEQYPHVWAIHNPIDRTGAEHPHMHLMLHERRQVDQVQRGPKQYFARAAAAGQDPATHGVLKDRSWQGPARLYELRAGIAMLTNAALERAGVEAAVSHESLRARGLTRQPCVYTTGQDKARVETEREHVHQWHHRYENVENVVMWRYQKAEEKITDISRAAMVDRVRDRFWLKDESLAREQEQHDSVWRSIHREHQRTGRSLQGPRQEASHIVVNPNISPRSPLRDLTARLIQLQARLERLVQQRQEEQAAGAALNIRLYECDRERDQSMGW